MGLLSTGFCETHSLKFHRLISRSASPRVPFTKPPGYQPETARSRAGKPRPAGEVAAGDGLWRSWCSKHALKLQDLTAPEHFLHLLPLVSPRLPSSGLVGIQVEDKPSRTDP